MSGWGVLGVPTRPGWLITPVRPVTVAPAGRPILNFRSRPVFHEHCTHCFQPANVPAAADVHRILLARRRHPSIMNSQLQQIQRLSSPGSPDVSRSRSQPLNFPHTSTPSEEPSGTPSHASRGNDQEFCPSPSWVRSPLASESASSATSTNKNFPRRKAGQTPPSESLKAFNNSEKGDLGVLQDGWFDCNKCPRRSSQDLTSYDELYLTHISDRLVHQHEVIVA